MAQQGWATVIAVEVMEVRGQEGWVQAPLPPAKTTEIDDGSFQDAIEVAVVMNPVGVWTNNPAGSPWDWGTLWPLM